MEVSQRVFRLRQLPTTADRLDAINLLAEAIGIKSSAIKIYSLARAVDIYIPDIKTATLMFDPGTEILVILQQYAVGNSGNEWKIKIKNLPHDLILDSHFRGFTPLYDPEYHQADCIALSGLSSHPFGSWQQKDSSKTFMWIRDALPKALPKVRPILYGYDTMLQNSNSFQSIFDLGCGLLNQLQAKGWTSPTAKPLIFLAHSLGGLVLKQAFVSLFNLPQLDNPLRYSIRGAILFGVPNFGMEHASLLSMVVGQPNEMLVRDLAPGSEYLDQLDKQFTGISLLQDLRIYWAYETLTSPTVQRDSVGHWMRSGPKKIFVTPDSATRGLHGCTEHTDYFFPINEDHSTMVKFSQDDFMSSVVVHKLSSIMIDIEARVTSSGHRNHGLEASTSVGDSIAAKQKVAKLGDVMISLKATEQDYRINQIEERYDKTFDWIFDLSESGFNNWLQSGTGIFWINGKPGSGKSTLMKFIFQDARTSTLLSDWKMECSPISIYFFFHHRGSALQKSFEGLLRSIIWQILKKVPNFYEVITPHLRLREGESVYSQFWTLLKLQTILHKILEQVEIPLYLTIFLDALDEYDGPKEFICKFLMDISNIPQTPHKNIRVCFSSRPWDIFLTNFKKFPSLKLQDYTRDDIRNYCLDSLKSNKISTLAFEELIFELVENSQGVFLWVKLVVQDLAAAIRLNQTAQELVNLLRSLPKELDEYYAEIITRIPSSHRWKTYAMLEVAVRPDDFVPEPREFICAVECSDCTTYESGIAKLKKIQEYVDKNYSYGTSYSHVTRKESKYYCGGLIEVHTGVQVLHQTVVDFVHDVKFKNLVLQERSMITVENGWSFLAKYYLLESELQGRELHYVTKAMEYSLEADQTTGRSIKSFLDTFPVKFFQRGGNGYPWSTTPLGFATLAGLYLYVAETLETNPDILQTCIDPLADLAIIRHPMFPDKDGLRITNLLLQKGFKLTQRPDILQAIMEKIGVRAIRSNQQANNESDLRLVSLLIGSGMSADIELGDGKRPLHTASFKIASFLIDQGANVNILDSVGMTPLDAVFLRAQAHGIDNETNSLISLLLERGGKVKTTGIKTIQKFLQSQDPRYKAINIRMLEDPARMNDIKSSETLQKPKLQRWLSRISFRSK